MMKRQGQQGYMCVGQEAGLSLTFLRPSFVSTVLHMCTLTEKDGLCEFVFAVNCEDFLLSFGNRL